MPETKIDAPPGNNGFTPEQVNQELFLELQRAEAEKLEMAKQLQELLNAVETMQQAPPTVLQEPTTKPRFSLPDLSCLNLGSVAPTVCLTFLAMYTLHVVTNLTPSAQVVALANRAADNTSDVAKIQNRPNETRICMLGYCPPDPATTATENAVEAPQQSQTWQQSPPPPKPPLTPPQVPQIYTATIIQNANLREAPSLDSRILFTMPGGDRFVPLQRSGDWVLGDWVQVDNTQDVGYKVLSRGYVANTLIKQ